MKSQKQINTAIIIAFFTKTILVYAIIAPIYTAVSSNILYKSYYIAEILYYLQQMIMYVSYPIIFSLIIYSVYTCGQSKSAFWLPAVLVLFEKAVTFTVDVCMSAYHSSILASAIIYSFIDIFQFIAIAMIAKRLTRQKLIEIKTKKKAAELIGEEYSEPVLLPFSTLFDRKNPLLISALFASAIMMGIQIISRIRFDILTPISGFEDILTMFFYYTFDIVTGFVTYLIIVFLLLSFVPKESKKSKQ